MAQSSTRSCANRRFMAAAIGAGVSSPEGPPPAGFVFVLTNPSAEPVTADGERVFAKAS